MEQGDFVSKSLAHKTQNFDKPIKVYTELFLELSDLGFNVITTNQNKKPTLEWTEYQTRVMTKDESLKFLNHWDSYHPAIITGVSDFETFDLDFKNLDNPDDHETEFERFKTECRNRIQDFDQKFVYGRTMNKGYHLYYKCNKIDKPHVIAKNKNGGTLIETRSKKQLAVIYPDKLINGSYRDIIFISESDRDILFSIGREWNEYISPEQVVKFPSSSVKQQYTDKSTPWSEFDNSTDVLTVAGDDFIVVKETEKYIFVKRTNGQTDSQHSGKVFKDSGLLYLHSTSTRYPENRGLSPTAVYAHKYHNGDFSAAAKDLYYQGFGDRIEINNVIDMAPVSEKVNIGFPNEIFSDNTRELIEQNSAILKINPEFFATSILSVLSTCIGLSHSLRVKNGWEVSGCLWFALVAPTGVGKTPALSAAFSPLNKVNRDKNKEYEQNLKQYDQDIKKFKEDKENNSEPRRPVNYSFIVKDSTTEALMSKHDEVRKGVVMLQDELEGWFNGMNSYKSKGNDRQRNIEYWNGESVSIQRKMSGNIYLPKTFINLIGGIQPEVASQSMDNREGADDGLIPRFLFCYPDAKVEPFSYDEVPQYLIDSYEKEIRGFLGQIERSLVYDDGDITPRILSYSESARSIFIEFDKEMVRLMEESPKHKVSFYAKMRTYIHRLALVIQVYRNYVDNNNSTEITDFAINGAIKLVEYYSANVFKLQDSIDLDKYLTELQVKISKEKKSGKEITKNEIRESCIELRKRFPDISARGVAKVYGVSHQTVRNYWKESA